MITGTDNKLLLVDVRVTIAPADLLNDLILFLR